MLNVLPDIRELPMAHILSILELDRRFACEAPKNLKVAERLRRQLMARNLFSYYRSTGRRMFIGYSPSGFVMPQAIEILKDGSMRRA